MNASTTISLPASDVDPFDEEFLADPLPYHEQLRELGPVFYLSRYDVYGVARYDEVHRALVDWQSLQSGAGVGLANFNHEKPWRPPSLLLEADPPRHDAPRHVLQQLLSPRRLRELTGYWDAEAVRFVDAVLARGPEFDAVTELAQLFPLQVIPDALGLGEEARDNLLPYGDFAFNAFGPRNDLVTDGEKTIGPIVSWVNEQCKRENLAEGGIGDQIWCAADRGDITHAQAPLMVRSLLTAGLDTTITGIAAVMHAFASHPDQWQRVRQDRSLLPRAFEEAVRVASPVQTFFRTTTTEIEIAGTVIPEDRKVLMFLASANHDPRRWEDPLRFDLSRDPSGHVGFGMGVHQCVGQHVARFEAMSVLNALLDRIDGIEMAGEPRWHLNNTLRGFDSVPVRVSMAA